VKLPPSPCRLSLNKNQGFSLIELAISIAILAIIITVAIPGFSTQVNNTRERSAQDMLITAINTSRSEAIVRNSLAKLSLSSACTGGTGSCISLEVEDKTTGVPGDFAFEREWAHEKNINYIDAGGDGTVHFSAIGFLSTPAGAQMEAPVDIQVVLGSERSQHYCVTVSGNVVKGSCS